MFLIVRSMKKKSRDCCGKSLLVLSSVALALSYPLVVPVVSVYYSGKVLLGGEDEGDRLTTMKQLKMFEHLGEYFLLSNS